MINELSEILADKLVNLSPEVRVFCEENSRKSSGDPPRFQTMSDAWIFLVLEGLASGKRFEGELKKTKDAFRWRQVNTNFNRVLLLRALLDGKCSESKISDIGKHPHLLLEHLERLAHQGVQSL